MGSAWLPHLLGLPMAVASRAKLLGSPLLGDEAWARHRRTLADSLGPVMPGKGNKLRVLSLSRETVDGGGGHALIAVSRLFPVKKILESVGPSHN